MYGIIRKQKKTSWYEYENRSRNGEGYTHTH
jgi:hypothetical protein